MVLRRPPRRNRSCIGLVGALFLIVMCVSWAYTRVFPPAPPPTLDAAGIITAIHSTALQAQLDTQLAPQPSPFPSLTASASPLPLLLPSATAPPLPAVTLTAEGTACIANTSPQTGRIVQVVDGDTIKVTLDQDGLTYSLRYIGMDTPEMNPADVPFAAEARARNAELALGNKASLFRDVSEVDRYDRLLRYVVVDGVFINYQLVAEGLAKAVAYPPDTACHDALQAAQQQALTAGLGMWAADALPGASRSGGIGDACNCYGPDLDCSDFTTHAGAQACYDSCVAAGLGNIFNLDGEDNDGLACETLP